MRVLVIDPDPARAALVAEGLEGDDRPEVRQTALFDAAEVAAFAPDIIVVACDSADRDTRRVKRPATMPLPGPPISVFATRSCGSCEPTL